MPATPKYPSSSSSPLNERALLVTYVINKYCAYGACARAVLSSLFQFMCCKQEEEKEEEEAEDGKHASESRQPPVSCLTSITP
uniref:Uncharacterized protein n=1 Tax=Syphacia muris TaxID=451379 RepID=A0A158R564_9BILA